jgi:serine/threonine protein kinase
VLATGAIIDGKYRVVRLVGEGGMGAVYEGQNLRIDRRVAIKVMHASMTADRLLVQRFEREAQAASKIASSHVADVLDLGDLPDGDRYMVMEFLDGESLAARLKAKKRMTPVEIAPIAVQLLEGLAKVHEAGILHRDLKPANIFLARAEDGTDFVKILDFGICKMTKGKGELSTGVGNLLGTVGYMCPEQLEHGPKSLDHRADLYTVGVVIYRAVTATLPYRAKNLVDLLHLMRQGRPAHVCELAPDVDPKFGAIVDKAIEWDPKARYPTANDLQKALLDWYSGLERIDRILGDFLEKPAAPPTVQRASVHPPRATAPVATAAATAPTAPGRRAHAPSDPDDIELEFTYDPQNADARPTADPKKSRRRTSSSKVATASKLAPDEAKARKSIADIDIDIDDEAVTIPKMAAPSTAALRTATQKLAAQKKKRTGR